MPNEDSSELTKAMFQIGQLYIALSQARTEIEQLTKENTKLKEILKSKDQSK